MATVKATSKVELSVTLKLTEKEARALDEMTKYGIESFLKAYHKYLGKHYIKPHEEGLRSLFKTIDAELPAHIQKIDNAREIFNMPKVKETPKARARMFTGKGFSWLIPKPIPTPKK